jgi:hypothetical protein
LVLFLVREEHNGGEYYPKAGWSAAWFGLFEVSVAWVEDGTAYVIDQMENPGPQVIRSYGSEDRLKQDVTKVQATLQKQYETARDEKDPKARAALFAKMIQDGTSYDDRAVEHLTQCGPAGVTALTKFAVAGPYQVRLGLTAAAALAGMGAPAKDAVLAKITKEAKEWTDYPWLGREIYKRHELQEQRQFLHALFDNPDLFRNLTEEQENTVRRVLKLCEEYPDLDARGPGRTKLSPVLKGILGIDQPDPKLVTSADEMVELLRTYRKRKAEAEKQEKLAEQALRIQLRENPERLKQLGIDPTEPKKE